MSSAADVQLTEDEVELKELVKKASKATLVLGDEWALVHVDWMSKWALYVNLDEYSSRYMVREHPGPIDNTPLLENGRLKRNLIEHLNFSLLPLDVYRRLVATYSGGPEIKRKVTNAAASRYLNIDLYPITYNVYLSDGNEVPKEPKASIEISKYSSYEAIKRLVLSSIELEESTRCNVWIRSPEYFSNYKTEKAEDSTGQGRRMTVDKTDVLPDYWELLDDANIRVYNYPDGVIDLMVELKKPQPASLGSSEGEGVEDEHIQKKRRPSRAELEDADKRSGFLSLWLKDLRPGDMVDGKDSTGRWCEAVVKAVSDEHRGDTQSDSKHVDTQSDAHENKQGDMQVDAQGDTPIEGSIGLHYMGWAENWDDTLLPHEIPYRVWPLYSKTRNWRALLRVTDRVELLRINEDGARRWELATVASIDYTGALVKVRVFKNGVQDFVVLPLLSEKICSHPTHVKTDPVPAATSSSLTVSSSSSTSYLSSAYSSLTGRWMSGRSHETGRPQGGPGVVGLKNLGNTCFMNSMLQCLSHAKSLTDVFLSDRHLQQINTSNVLGMGGKLAKSYGSLLKDMWSEQYSVVNPFEFKDIIGEFQPQFSGYQQQDSQEFMLFLLDGLHEDLNRVVKKPFVEKIESKGRPDELISRESWRRFLLRNDSEVVDRVFGQLRSHVTCRNCGYESVTFDEFNSLSLPVPVKNTRSIALTVYPLPVGSTPIIVEVDVEVTSSVAELKRAVVRKLGPLLSAQRELPPKCNSRANSPIRANDDHMELDSSDSYVVVDSNGDSPVASLSNTDRSVARPASAMDVVPPPAPSSSSLDNIECNLHVCSYRTYSKAVSSTLQDDSPVQDLLRGNSSLQLLVYQLQHNVTPKDDYQYSTYSSTNKYSTNGSKTEKQEDSQFRHLDIVMLQSSKPPAYQHYTNYPTILGPPIRISIELGVTTYREVYEIVERVALALLPATSPFKHFSRSGGASFDQAVNEPFAVHFSDQYALNISDPFPFDSYEPIKGDIRKNTLMCLWKDAVLEEPSGSANTIEKKKRSPVVENLFLRQRFVASTGTLTDPESIDADYLPSDEVAAAPEKKTIDIVACFDKFIEREVLPDEETWYCPSCKVHKSPIKKFDVWAAPEILIIQLKRFQYIPGSYFIHREKINDLINFPIEGLDLSSYIRGPSSANGPPVYDLFAVSEHSGGLGGGHYTAVAKSPDTDKWVNYNDSYCSAATLDDIVTPQAYVLFYRRRGGSLKWAGIEPLPEGTLSSEKSSD